MFEIRWTRDTLCFTISSLNPKDKRNLYFFTVQAEDYSIFFPCERSRTEYVLNALDVHARSCVDFLVFFCAL